METNELQKKWPELKKKILAEHPDLTEEELLYEIGNESDLLDRLQIKLKKNKKEIDNYLALLG